MITYEEALEIARKRKEKDYYVTMILKQLSLNAKNCVFKGGNIAIKMPSRY